MIFVSYDLNEMETSRLLAADFNYFKNLKEVKDHLEEIQIKYQDDGMQMTNIRMTIVPVEEC